jgi:hypothetical protein
MGGGGGGGEPETANSIKKVGCIFFFLIPIPHPAHILFSLLWSPIFLFGSVPKNIDNILVVWK